MEPVIVSRLFDQVVQRTHRTRFRIEGTENESCHARLHQTSGAHGTWLKRHIQGDTREPPSTDFPGCGIHCQHFCVSERIAVHFAAIETSANDFTVEHRHRTYGDLSEFRCFPRER
ncbi:hypothetical protein BHS05_09235 [Myxococcus xanthus]|nr:hypothetical protein BHS05_09235 [Myxococcus xanthus]